MSTIGYFKKSATGFIGEIVTLTLRASGVRIVGQDVTDNDKTPSWRVYVGRAEIGAGWDRRSENGKDFISFKLDDPSFDAPIYASLVEDEDSDEGGYNLLWSRPRKNHL